MQVFRSWRWSASAVAFCLTAPVARAEWVTPDSIVNPPRAVGSANGTTVSQSNLVTGQYAGLGLNFSGGAAITRLNGVSVWAPIAVEHLGISGSLPVMLNYGGRSVFGSVSPGMLNPTFVSPGTLNPTTVTSLTVTVLGNPSLSMSVYDLNHVGLNITPVITSVGGVQNWTFNGSGISSFYAATNTTTSQPWGIAAISYSPATTPEPSSLVLAGLGALGLATRLRWRLLRRVA